MTELTSGNALVVTTLINLGGDGQTWPAQGVAV